MPKKKNTLLKMNYDQLLYTATELYLRRNRDPGMSIDVLKRLNELIDPLDKQKIYDPYQIIPKMQKDLSKRLAVNRELYELLQQKQQEKQHLQKVERAGIQRDRKRQKASQDLLIAKELFDKTHEQYKLALETYNELFKFPEPDDILHEYYYVPRNSAMDLRCDKCGKTFNEYGKYYKHENKCTGKSEQDKQKKRMVLKQIQQVALRPGGRLYYQALQDFNSRI